METPRRSATPPMLRRSPTPVRSGDDAASSGSSSGSVTLEGHEQLLRLLRKRQEAELLEACNDPRAPVHDLIPGSTSERLEKQRWKQEKLRNMRLELQERELQRRGRRSERGSRGRSAQGARHFGSAGLLGKAADWGAGYEEPVARRSGSAVFREVHSEGGRTPRRGDKEKSKADSRPTPRRDPATARDLSALRQSLKDSLRERSLKEREGDHFDVPPSDLAECASYFTHGTMYDADGKEVPLENRDIVLRMLHDLRRRILVPICKHFNLRHDFFFEQHCQEKKAGVARREPRTLTRRNPDGSERKETRYVVTIRLRLRVHPSKGDPQTEFLSQGSQLAVLLHELCHLRYMDHGKDFMLFLAEIFREATRIGVFKPGEMTNEVPSNFAWENEIFRVGGNVDNDTLLLLFAQHESMKARAASSRSRTPTRGCDAGGDAGAATARSLSRTPCSCGMASCGPGALWQASGKLSLRAAPAAAGAAAADGGSAPAAVTDGGAAPTADGGREDACDADGVPPPPPPLPGVVRVRRRKHSAAAADASGEAAAQEERSPAVQSNEEEAVSEPKEEGGASFEKAEVRLADLQDPAALTAARGQLAHKQKKQPRQNSMNRKRRDQDSRPSLPEEGRAPGAERQGGSPSVALAAATTALEAKTLPAGDGKEEEEDASARSGDARHAAASDVRPVSTEVSSCSARGATVADASQARSEDGRAGARAKEASITSLAPGALPARDTPPCAAADAATPRASRTASPRKQVQEQQVPSPRPVAAGTSLRKLRGDIRDRRSAGISPATTPESGHLAAAATPPSRPESAGPHSALPAASPAEAAAGSRSHPRTASASRLRSTAAKAQSAAAAGMATTAATPPRRSRVPRRTTIVPLEDLSDGSASASPLRANASRSPRTPRSAAPTAAPKAPRTPRSIMSPTSGK
eukprot:TRINITY_DN20238_c0_g1_i1.p1 TRINITY_DN20238_c0_g1~~TRINITY_DN20238_c0_g1_i1.p1  ORF type:complete len:927 (+),score=211.91 TRINITY_DN20238_c0_g1_i1:92-2872(+)